MILVVFPTANVERQMRACAAWKQQGYTPVAWTDHDFGRYPGYFCGVNEMIRHLWHSAWEVAVVASDDNYPDPDKDAAECLRLYKGKFPLLDGVMQPAGDDLPGTAEICGSPWIGRYFILNHYMGMGPYYPAYRHFYGDEELLHVATRDDKLWMPLGITQRHEHWLRGTPKTTYQNFNDRYWNHDQALFRQRKAAGFPGA